MKRKSRHETYNSENLTGSGTNVKEIVQKVPKNLKLNAKSLLLLIKDKDLFKWNSKGEIVVKDNTIKGSNIIKLLIHALTRNKNKPIGYKTFYSHLKKVRIPRFILCKNLKKYTQNVVTQEWRPPGILIRKKSE